MICENRQRLPLVVDVDKWPGTYGAGKLMSTLKRENEMKLTSILIILLFAFTLVACGGGGGSSRTPDPMPDPEMPVEPTPEEQAAADEATMAANDAATAANAAAMAAMDAVNAATLADTMAASDAAQAATDAAQAATDAAAAVMAGDMATLDAANAAAMAADDAATAATMAASDLITAEEDAVAEAEAETARMAAEQARIMGLTAAIADPDGDGKIAGDDESDDLTHRRPGVDPSFEAGGVTKVTEGTSVDQLDSNNPRINNANEFQPISQSRAELMHYEVSVHQRTTTKGAIDTLTVYTNVEDAGGEAYNEYFNEDDFGGSAAGDGIEEVGTDGGVTTDEKRTTYNTITFASDEIGEVSKYMSGSKIPTAADRRFEIESTDTTLSFNGQFYGVPGKYTCPSGCVFFTDEDGQLSLTAASDDVTFRPTATNNDTEDEHVVAGINPDPDYISFGYWMRETTTGGEKKYGVKAFSGGSMAYGGTAATISSRIGELDGSATYDGSATGMYTRKELEIEDGRAVVGTPVAAGQFSADVSLTAHFGSTAAGTDPINGSDKISVSEAFSISGTVDNFQDASGDSIDRSWAVNLGQAKFDATNDDTVNYLNTFGGTTGSGALQGQWTGGIYGPSYATDDTTTENIDETTQGYPTGVAGEFTGHFTNGHVIGAFGATQ